MFDDLLFYKTCIFSISMFSQFMALYVLKTLTVGTFEIKIWALFELSFKKQHPEKHTPPQKKGPVLGGIISSVYNLRIIWTPNDFLMCLTIKKELKKEKNFCQGT